MEKEIWKDIPGYELKYQVSNLWNVRSYNFKKLWYMKTHKLQIDWWWYYRATLCHQWKQKKISIHRLVAESFIWEAWWLQVNHIDGDKSNNKVSNLEYCTCSENVLHSFNKLWRKWSSTWKFWSLHHNSMRVLQVDKSWNIVWEYWSQLEANRTTWISNSHIWDCIHWRSKTAWWYVWKRW